MLLQSLQQFPGENHSIPITSPSALAAADMTVLERQIARLHWQQQQRQLQPQQQEPPPPPSYFAATIAADISLVSAPYSIPQPPQMLPSSAVGLHTTNFCGEQDMISHDLSTGSGGVWPHLTNYPLLCNSSPRGGGVTGGRGAISRTFSCPQTSQLEHSSTAKDGAAAAAVAAALSTDRARESSKKRKAAERDGTHKLKEDDREKKVIKVENTNTLVEPKLESPSIMSSSTAITTNNCNDNNREASSSASKEQPKVPEPAPMTDYIHVRARRGQATDSHSLAERVRREKISDRMKLLQDLVPGCNKITGKAGMLDEIINYVQSLQRQVEFLSMKLAAVTPALDFNLDALLAEISMLAGDGGILAQLGLSPELLGLSFLQFNPLQQQALAAAAATDCCSLPLPMASSCGPTEVPVCSFAATPGPATESCSFPNTRNILVPSPPSTTSGWEGDLQRFYNTMEEFEQVRGSFTAC